MEAADHWFEHNLPKANEAYLILSCSSPKVHKPEIQETNQQIEREVVQSDQTKWPYLII